MLSYMGVELRNFFGSLPELAGRGNGCVLQISYKLGWNVMMPEIMLLEYNSGGVFDQNILLRLVSFMPITDSFIGNACRISNWYKAVFIQNVGMDVSQLPVKSHPSYAYRNHKRSNYVLPVVAATGVRGIIEFELGRLDRSGTPTRAASKFVTSDDLEKMRLETHKRKHQEETPQNSDGTSDIIIQDDDIDWDTLLDIS